MNTLPQGVHIPLQVTCEGEPVSLASAAHLRRLRSYLDTWIGIYDKAEKLPQLPPLLSTSDIPTEAATEPVQVSAEAEKTQEGGTDTNAEPSTAATVPRHTIDYIVEALQTHNVGLRLATLYEQVCALGWSTSSPDKKLALRNLENTARKYNSLVTLNRGTVRLVKPG